MSFDVFLDCETIPTQAPEALESLLADALITFCAPRAATKAQLGADLGMSDSEIRAVPLPDLRLYWETAKREEMSRAKAVKQWRDTSLNPEQGELFSISWAMNNDSIHTAWRQPDQSEANLLLEAFSSMAHDLGHDEGGPRRPFFIGHNVRFDLGFLWKRAVILGVKPPFRLPWDGRHDNQFYCTMTAWAGFNKSVSQDRLCQLLGLELKPDGIDGSKVWDLVADLEYGKVIEYNRHDVETVRKIHNRINFK